jgi:hypothetical protein
MLYSVVERRGKSRLSLQPGQEFGRKVSDYSHTHNGAAQKRSKGGRDSGDTRKNLFR